jgi:26S proteasome regulatory subunit N8
LRLRDIGTYLQKVLDNDLPVNHAILGNLQDVFNLLPNLSTPKPTGAAQTNGVAPAGSGDNSELARAMSIKTNDQLMAIYLSSLIRAITAFHDLIENKIQNRQQHEEKEGGDKKEVDEKKDKAGAEKEGEDKEKKVNGVNGEVKDAEKGKDKKEGGKKNS